MSLPSCGGRFPPLCSTSFPEVSNYDFESNLTTRGVEDVGFRWEDIYLDSNWLFSQSSFSGELEANSFSITITGTSGARTITHPSTSYLGYPGWQLTGGYTVFVGGSGSYLYTGNLSGYLGDPFWANPIEGYQSIGLWCNSQSVPKILSDDILNTSTGIQYEEDHQVYLVAFANKATGSSPRLKAYIRAQTGNTVLGYYDPIDRSWTATYPTGSFSISTGSYTEIKYSFSPSSLPFSTPDRYKLVVENHTTGAFITVDDLHIDQYLQKNPYMNYILPTGYVIQMTPDLGWHNTLAQFDGDNSSLNPFLKTFGPYSIDLGNLVDNLDNTVTALIDSGDFLSVCNSTYRKYLWRAIAVAPNGDLGKAGYPEKFEWIGSNIEFDFDIIDVRESPTSPEKTIIGKRNNRMSIIVDDILNHPGIEYPSDNTWRLTIHVDGSSKVIALAGKDIGGARTRKRYVELKNETYDLSTQAVWNVFDEHGLLLDLKRLPNESNKDYMERLKDVNRNRGGSTYQGIANSSTREVGLTKVSDGIVISIPKNEYDGNIHPSLDIEFGSAYVNIKSPNMVITERLYVDPVYNTVDLSKSIANLPTYVITKEKLEIPTTKVSIDIDRDRPSINRIKINYTLPKHSYVDVTYQYYETLYYKDHQTLESLIIALESLRDNSGHKLVSAKLSMKLSGNESPLGLYIVSDIISNDATMSVAWTPIRLRRISDNHFREYFVNNDNSYHETKFQEYVNELRHNSRTLWGEVEIDRDFWDAADSTKDSFDSIPTLADPTISKFFLSGEIQNIDGSMAWSRNFIGNNRERIVNQGLSHKIFQPGVAHKNDLLPDVYVHSIQTLESQYLRSNTSVVKNDNKIVIFSGQR